MLLKGDFSMTIRKSVDEFIPGDINRGTNSPYSPSHRRCDSRIPDIQDVANGRGSCDRSCKISQSTSKEGGRELHVVGEVLMKEENQRYSTE